MKLLTTATITMIALTLALRSATAFLPRNGASVVRSNASSNALFATKAYPVIASEDVMSQKAHGTSSEPVQKNLRWNCDFQTADRICNFVRTAILLSTQGKI
jgi:hypothetical protein